LKRRRPGSSAPLMTATPRSPTAHMQHHRRLCRGRERTRTNQRAPRKIPVLRGPRWKARRPRNEVFATLVDHPSASNLVLATPDLRYQTKPGRHSQLIGSSRSRAAEAVTRQMWMHPSSVPVRIRPEPVRTKVGPRQRPTPGARRRWAARNVELRARMCPRCDAGPLQESFGPGPCPDRDAACRPLPRTRC